MTIRGFLLACAIILLPCGAQAAMPQLPCAGSVPPAYSPPGADPVIAIWHAADLEQGKWQPPGCTGWAGAARSSLVVSLAGSFHFDGTLDRLLARAGAISQLPNVQYWSTTDKKWRPLAYDASALTGPNAKSRRADFTAADLAKDADLYYWEKDSRSGEIVYRLRVYENAPDRVLLASENVTPVRQFLMTMFKPGALQSVIAIQRLSPGIFGVTILSRTGEGTSFLAQGHDASYVNRAVALYRQLAGTKTDQEPPGAR